MKRQRHLNLLFVTLLALVIGFSACHDSEWDEMPSQIQTFINQYFPGLAISSYNETDDGTYSVSLRNSATLTFDSNLKWTSINGQGVALPPTLAYDQFPTPLYKYLEETEQQGQVYSVSRNSTTYELTLHNSYLSYQIATQEITVK